MNIWSVFDLLAPVCPICGLAAGRRSQPCFCCHAALPRLPANTARLPGIDRHIAACAYAFPVDQLVQQLKFGGRMPLAGTLGQLLAQAAAADATRPSALVPIPLHPDRAQQRGFNQAEALARVVGRTLQLPVLADRVVRTRATPAQSGLDLHQRQRNLADAFSVIGPLPAHVALIDDVVTTGSTMLAMANTLRRHGVTRVEAWAVARTL